ncbi:MAG TPA: alpha/beta hydrolase [Dyella sp.]|uniref:alpha/beta hydrolase n=1 Tax=Dyella sp. TaxID=1869338 RepID=UPI002C3D977E|nr:alpha/beta hydrolase [Dyella sp.]HUB91842.1 alpha/beta hydrolase [Dyella sp.]
MLILRKKIAMAFMLALGTAAAQAAPQPAVKDIVIVHGALVAGSGWRAVHDILTKDGFHVTIVQEPNTSLTADVAATERAIADQTGSVVLVGHSYAGSVITEAGADPKVHALVYVSALQPDVGEASGQLLQKFAVPNNAMRADVDPGTKDPFLFLPPAKFRASYAADVPAPEAQFLADSQEQLAQKALGAPVTVAAWHTKPSYAVLTTLDHMVSPKLQSWMYERSHSKVTEVAASHASFISHPDVIARVIETAAKQAD